MGWSRGLGEEVGMEWIRFVETLETVVEREKGQKERPEGGRGRGGGRQKMKEEITNKLKCAEMSLVVERYQDLNCIASTFQYKIG